MLRYASVGPRSYGDRPLPPHVRSVWEFQAVVDGRCSFWLPERRSLARAATLWVSAPRLRHGWSAERGATCRICVLHFTTIPELLRVAVERTGWLELRLTDESRARMVAIGERAAALAPGDPLRPLRADAVLADLSLLVAEMLPLARVRAPAPDGPPRMVEEALAWYAANLPSQPTVADVADAVGVSTAHLRRQFQAVQRRPPHSAFTELRMVRAEELLLADPDLTLDALARQCGFAGGSVFSRTFRRFRGVPPANWARRRRGRPAGGLLPSFPTSP